MSEKIHIDDHLKQIGHIRVIHAFVETALDLLKVLEATIGFALPKPIWITISDDAMYARSISNFEKADCFHAIGITEDCVANGSLNKFVFQFGHELMHHFIGIEYEHAYVELHAVAFSCYCLGSLCNYWENCLSSFRETEMVFSVSEKHRYSEKLKLYLASIQNLAHENKKLNGSVTQSFNECFCDHDHVAMIAGVYLFEKVYVSQPVGHWILPLRYIGNHLTTDANVNFTKWDEELQNRARSSEDLVLCRSFIKSLESFSMICC